MKTFEHVFFRTKNLFFCILCSQQYFQHVCYMPPCMKKLHDKIIVVTADREIKDVHVAVVNIRWENLHEYCFEQKLCFSAVSVFKIVSICLLHSTSQETVTREDYGCYSWLWDKGRSCRHCGCEMKAFSYVLFWTKKCFFCSVSLRHSFR